MCASPGFPRWLLLRLLWWFLLTSLSLSLEALQGSLHGLHLLFLLTPLAISSRLAVLSAICVPVTPMCTSESRPDPFILDSHILLLYTSARCAKGI